ncbi:MBL fold metallo-hydrolase [Paenibacillus sp. MWE-103]|uniref:MBL fold metallo-hydrolase n=1 Tax=Paenibacillus artemisiicola TaxID=1172618 RepID=A0ABS3W7V6_9BACL|nr:MBL fold metallo-hydrolase [Paenibacillus artemisiicola]MBO7744374.1 MBL fold metallo-hydrolase [Paenibacillus artemisiicola]
MAKEFSATQVRAPYTRPMTAKDFEPSDTTSVWWLSGAGFLIQSHGTLLMIDPVISMQDGSDENCELGHRLLVPLPIEAADVPRLDAILYTHRDDDHLGPVTASALIRTGGLYAGPAIVVQELERLGVPSSQARAFRIGESFRIGEIEITLTRADHAYPSQNPYGPEDCCGFFIRTPDGTIWCTGDTRLLAEHMQMSGVDVLLLDVSDDPYHFGVENAVNLANRLEQAAIIPHHYGTYHGPEMLPFNGDPNRLAPHITRSENRYRILAPGERYVLKKTNDVQ